MGLGMSVIKLLLYVFNAVCFLCGLILTTVGSVFLGVVADYEEVTTHMGAHSVPIAFIVLGVFMCLVSIIGCCGTMKESIFLMIVYGIVCFLLLVSTTAVIIYMFAAYPDEEILIKETLDSLWKHASEPGSAFQALQRGLHCCGKTGSKDWPGKLPETCCDAAIAKPVCLEKNAYRLGCERALNHFINKYFNVLAYAGVTVLVVELIAFVCSSCLIGYFRRRRHRDVE